MIAVASSEQARIDVIRLLEWSGPDGDCLVCGYLKSDGHHASCRLAAALAPSPESTEVLVPPAVCELCVPIEHVLKLVEWIGPERSCPVCGSRAATDFPSRLPSHTRTCPLHLILAAIPSMDERGGMTYRRGLQTVPAAWPAPSFTHHTLELSLAAKMVTLGAVPNTTVAVRLEDVAFAVGLTGARRVHRILDVAQRGDELILLVGQMVSSTGFLDDAERRDARRTRTRHQVSADADL